MLLIRVAYQCCPSGVTLAHGNAPIKGAYIGRMAQIAFFGPMGPGHVNPMLGPAAELVRRGHDVTFAAPEVFAERISETDAEYVPAPTTWAGGATTVPQMHGRELVRAMNLLLAETKVVHAALADRPAPDLVVHDGPLAWWGRLLARQWGVLAVETWPNLVSNEHWSMHHDYTKFNPLSPGFLLMLLRVGRYLKSQGTGDVGAFLQGTDAAARLVLLPRAFQYEGDTFGEGYRFVGPGLTERAFQSDWSPTSDAPVVLVSLGTSYNDRPEFYRMVAQSARGLPWQVVMAIGRTDPAALGELPDNVEIHAQVPQLAVLRRASVFVTHAGMGGTMEGLSFGVPLVALPQMAEQRANADRIQGLGLGLALDPEHLGADTLWKAVARVAEDAGVRERLEWMRGEIEAAGGAAAAADTVEEVLGRR